MNTATGRLPLRSILTRLMLALPLFAVLLPPRMAQAALGSWSVTGAMTEARSGHTATLLPDGHVLVVGPHLFVGPGPLSLTAELYNPDTNAWSATGTPQGLGRSHFTATLLTNGKVLVVGGDCYGCDGKSADLYDPVTGTWAATGRLHHGRGLHTATLLKNGDVLVVGSADSAELYNPSTETWSVTGTMGVARLDHTATLLPDGQVLVAGGLVANGCCGPLTTAEVFNPATGTWTPAGSMAIGRVGHTATLLPSGKVLLVGGVDYNKSVDVYDPATGLWSQGPPTLGIYPSQPSIGSHVSHRAVLLPNGQLLLVGAAPFAEIYDSIAGGGRLIEPMISSRGGHTATLLPSGKVLVAGGAMSGSGPSAELYEPRLTPPLQAPGRWIPTGSLNAPRLDHTASLLPDGRVLVAGGSDGLNNSLATAALYTPATGAWISAGALHTPRYQHSATVLQNGKVLVVGGRDSGVYGLASAEIYDPLTNQWAVTGSLTYGRYHHTATLLPSGKVLVVGGEYGYSMDRETAELYDPPTGTWSLADSPSSFRRQHTATLLTNGQVLVAGGDPYSVTTELYDPATGAWHATGDLSRPRTRHAAVRLSDGKVLIAGGSAAQYGSLLASAELYDPATESWRLTSGMNDIFEDSVATLLASGKILVAGNTLDAHFESLSAAEVYDPASETWSLTGSMAVVRRGGHTETLLTNGKVLAVGGYDTAALASAELYEAPAGVTLTPSPTPSMTPSPMPSPTPSATPNPTSSPTPSPPPDGPGPAPAGTMWYFAEGYTGPGFDEYLTIMNPNASAAQLRLTFYRKGQQPLMKTRAVGANGRDTLAVHDENQGVGRNGGRGWEVSTLVESANGVGVVVERPMYFTYTGPAGLGITGGHTVLGATAPRATWYFAEGYTGPGFDEYLTIMNPNANPVEVQVTYYRKGAAPLVKRRAISASTRDTIAVHDESEGVGRHGGQGWEVSALVESVSGGPIVAERPMYFRYQSSFTAPGGHDVVGASAPRISWYFAEGYTGPGFDEYLTIMNPNARPVDVRLTYYRQGQPPLVKTKTVVASTRETVAVHDEAQGVGRNGGVGWAVSALVESLSSDPIVVERPMYFRYQGSVMATGGHDVVGADQPHPRWAFAEGYTGAGFDEYLTIMNPNSQPVDVRFTYYLKGHAPLVKYRTIRGNTRDTVAVHDERQGVGRNNGQGWEVSVLVESTSSGTIIVERPMYFRYQSSFSAPGGHDVLGYAP